MLEALFVAPLLAMIFLFIFEYGLIFRDYLTVGDATSDAAKFASIQGNKLTSAGNTADYTAVALLRQNLANIPPSWLDRIVIFRAGSAAGGSPLSQVPAGCKTGASSAALKCNVYTTVYDAFRNVQTGNTAPFTCTGSQPACGWNPTSRKDGPTTADVEYLGIYIKVDRPKLTGLFGQNFTLEIATIQRLEPGQLTG